MTKADTHTKIRNWRWPIFLIILRLLDFFRIWEGGEKVFTFCKKMIQNCRVSCYFCFCVHCNWSRPWGTFCCSPQPLSTMRRKLSSSFEQQFSCTQPRGSISIVNFYPHMRVNQKTRKLSVFKRQTTILQITGSFSATMEQESNSRKEEYLWRACAHTTCRTHKSQKKLNKLFAFFPDILQLFQECPKLTLETSCALWVPYTHYFSKF